MEKAGLKVSIILIRQEMKITITASSQKGGASFFALPDLSI